MKPTLPLLLLVATASALPFQLNQLLSDLPQKSNTLDGGDNAGGVNAAVHLASFDASSFSSQPVPAAIAPNEPQQPAFVRGQKSATFGALLTDQETATQQPGVIKQDKNSKPFIESFAKQFSNNKQPAYGAAYDTQSGGNQAPSFGVSPGGQPGGNQQQAAFGESSNSQLGGNQQTGFGAPPEDQFRGNQEPAFGASSNSQFGGSQQSGFGAESGDKFGGSQTSFNPQSGGIQQGGPGISENNQFGGNQQSVPEAVPDTQFGTDQQAGFGSNFAGGPQNAAAAGSSGPYNVAFGDEYYIRTALPFAGYHPTKYTSLDLSQVDFQNALRSSGHEEYISVPGDDASDEAEVYRLVGVAPASAVQGGAAMTYSANIGATVPIYRELDDAYEERLLTQLLGGVNPQASVYSAVAGSQQPVRVKAEATLAGGSFALLLDD